MSILGPAGRKVEKADMILLVIATAGALRNKMKEKYAPVAFPDAARHLEIWEALETKLRMENDNE